MAFHALRVALYTALAMFSAILLALCADRLRYTTHTHIRHFYDPIVAELITTSALAFLWSLWHMYVILKRVERGFFSTYLSEIIGLLVLWVMFLVGAAIATHKWHNLSFCWSIRICRILSTLVAFSWICWVTTTFSLLSSLLSRHQARVAFSSPLHGPSGYRTRGAVGTGATDTVSETKDKADTTPVTRV